MAGYTIKATIEDTHPPVWRRIIIPEKINFGDLHRIIQIAFGWDDAHLHDFTFPKSELQIVESKENAFGDYLLERSALVDDFIREYKWIRYTYDFGDDWRHKIVYEKEMPEYNSRCAEIIKYKGDNFTEDSGGVWGYYVEAEDPDEEDTWEDSSRIPFSMDEANEQLQGMRITEKKGTAASRKKAKSSTQTKTRLRSGMKPDDVLKMFQESMLEMQAKMEQKIVAVVEKMDSEIDQQIDAWNDFQEQKQKVQTTGKDITVIGGDVSAKKSRQEMTKGAAGQSSFTPNADGQMTLPLGEMNREKDSSIFCAVKVPAMHTQAELLSGLSSKQIKDYEKYLRIPDSLKLSHEERARQIDALLAVHPEYYVYVMEPDELNMFCRLWKENDGILKEIPDQNAVVRAISFGLLEVHVVTDAFGGKAEIAFASDADRLFGHFNLKKSRKIYKKLCQTDERYMTILTYYGMMKLDMLYEKYCDLWRENIEKEDFFRILYWHGRMCDRIRTFDVLETHEPYCVPWELEDILNLVLMMQKYGSDLDYAPFSFEDLKYWQEMSLSYHECWADLGEYMRAHLKLEEPYLSSFVVRIYADVISGKTLQDIWKTYIQVLYSPENAAEWMGLWSHLISVIMQTPLAALKGHSRDDMIEFFGKKRPYPSPFSESELKTSISQNTHLIEMPADVQMKLYELMYDDSDSDSQKTFKNLIRKHGNNNLEMMLMLADMYLYENEPGEAEKILARCQDLSSSKDAGINERLEVVRELGTLDPEELEGLSKFFASMGGMTEEEMEELMNQALKELESEALENSASDIWEIPKADTQRKGIYGGSDWDTEEDDYALPEIVQMKPYVRETAKVGRNDPCPCGSGKKYKRCCGKK